MLIQIQGLAKYFGNFAALRDFNLTVSPGEAVALFGRNGAGKTTLLRLLAGLTRPSSGTITIGDETPQTARGDIGYLSHSTAVYSELTALENLRFYSCLLDIPCGAADLEERIRRVGLSGRENDLVRNYSRGMQQRLALARSFIHDPPILLLDEPFTGLDQSGTDFLKQFLADARARGKSSIMAIHDAALGYELSDRLVVIERGKVSLDAPKRSFSLEEFQSCYRSLALERGDAG